MRIQHIIADGAPGGGTTMVLSLAEGLLRRGEDVSLVTQSDSYAVEQARSMGIAAFGVNFFVSRLDPRVPFRLARIVRAVQPHLVHAHGLRAGFFFSFVAPRVHGVPVAYTVHGYHFQGKPWGLRHLAARAERRVSSRVGVTLHVSAADRNLAEEWHLLPPGGRSVIIHNGIDVSRIPSAENTDGRLIGFCGRVTFQKDPLLFVEVVRLLAKEGYRAVMIGGGDMEADVHRRIDAHGLGDRIAVTGSLPHADAMQLLRRVGVLVFPSRWEGLPTTPIEAMYMGVPVVAADVSGVSEIITSGVSGFVVREREAHRYAEVVRMLSEDATLRERIILEGQRTVIEKFTSERMVQQHAELYAELLESRGN